MDLKIIKRESSGAAKYDLFQRLNPAVRSRGKNCAAVLLLAAVVNSIIGLTNSGSIKASLTRSRSLTDFSLSNMI